MSEIKIYDNFLSPIEFGQIQSVFLDHNCPWEFSDNITTVYGNDGDKHGQFVKVLYVFNCGREKGYEKIEPVISKIQDIDDCDQISLLRVKINLNPKQLDVIQLGDYHTDFQFDCRTAIYYLTNSNGPTKFENGEVINCVANRLVVFPSHMKHCGFSCSDNTRRIVLNINYLPLYCRKNCNDYRY